MLANHHETCGRCHAQRCNCLCFRLDIATVIAQQLVDSGYTRESIIAELVYREFSTVTCVQAVAAVYGVTLDNAEKAVIAHVQV